MGFAPQFICGFVLCWELLLSLKLTVAGSSLLKPADNEGRCTWGAACAEVDRPFPDRASSGLMPGDFLGKSKEDVARCNHGKSSHLVLVRPGALGGLLFLQMGMGTVAALLGWQQYQQELLP